MKTGAGIRRVDPHTVDVQPSFNIQLALAHFKFYPGLDRRIEESLARRAHFSGAIEYEFLRAAVDQFAEESLICDQSRQYRSPRDLEDADLIWAV